MSPPNGVTTAGSSIVAGAAGGAVVATAGVVATRMLIRSGAHLPLDQGTLVLVAALLGLLFAVRFGWRLSRAIPDTWRRGVISALAAFGAVLLSVAAVPLDRLFSQTVVMVYLVVLVFVELIAARLAKRGGAAFRSAA